MGRMMLAERPATMEKSTMIAVVGACQGCGACLLTCPEHAIRPVWQAAGAARLMVREDLCTGCGECIEVCPVDAIELKGRGRG